MNFIHKKEGNDKKGHEDCMKKNTKNITLQTKNYDVHD